MMLDDRLDTAQLTAREREIVQFVAHGLSAKQIAQQVGIAPRTVERHIENMRHKLRAKNKSHMIAKAMSLGVIRFDGPHAADGAAPAIKFKPKLVANE